MSGQVKKKASSRQSSPGQSTPGAISPTELSGGWTPGELPGSKKGARLGHVDIARASPSHPMSQSARGSPHEGVAGGRAAAEGIPGMMGLGGGATLGKRGLDVNSS